jgi:hypothetical protein
VRGDRVIVVLCTHGRTDGSVTLCTSQMKEYLTRTEMGVALNGLATGTRVLLVNEACYSGSWSTLAPDTPGKDVLIEAASTIGGSSYNYRCSLFGAAFVQELTSSPEGNYANTRPESPPR